MTRRLKVMTIVGTRPEIIRLSRVMAALDRETDHLIVHTGQNYDYELNGVFFDDLGVRKPDHFLEAAGATAGETIGKILIAADALLEETRPDAVLVLGCDASRQRRSAQVAIDQQRTVTASRGEQGKIVG